jgi:cell division protein FtsZ
VAAKSAISSPLLEAAIDGARGILLNITGPSGLGLFEVNAAAEIIQAVAHPDANIIFGTVIDDEMGDEVKVTVIAAGFDRWESNQRGGLHAVETVEAAAVAPANDLSDLFAHESSTSIDDDDDGDFDVPSFLK